MALPFTQLCKDSMVAGMFSALIQQLWCAAAAVGAGSNLLKQNQIFPPPPSSAEEPGKRGRGTALPCQFPQAVLACCMACSSFFACDAGMKNVIRGLILAMAATFLGCAIFVTLPDTVASSFNRTMPYWFYEKQVRMCAWPWPACCCSMHCNALVDAAYR